MCSALAAVSFLSSFWCIIRCLVPFCSWRLPTTAYDCFVRVCVYECVSAIALMPPQCMCSISSRTGNRPPHQGQTVDGGPRSALSKCLQEAHPWTNELAIARPMNMHARVLYSHCCIKLTEFEDSDSRTFLAKKKPPPLHWAEFTFSAHKNTHTDKKKHAEGLAKLAIFYPDPILVPVLLPFSYVSLLVACTPFFTAVPFFLEGWIYIFYHSQSRCSAFSDVKLLRAVATRLHPLWLFLYSVITVGIFFAYCVYLRFRLSFFRSALHYFAFLAFFVCVCMYMCVLYFNFTATAQQV